MRHELLNKLGLGLLEDWNVSDLMLASSSGQAEGFTKRQLEKLDVLREAISEYNVSKPISKSERITDSNLATVYLYPVLKNLDHEECWILFLSRTNRIIKRMCLFKGGFSQTMLDNRQVLKTALLLGASGIIISHNHPSDDPTPGNADISSTKSLENACKAVDIMLLDHIIIANSSFYSFNENRISEYKQSTLDALASV